MDFEDMRLTLPKKKASLYSQTLAPTVGLGAESTA